MLVLVNGLPGSGKSSVARRYADAHPPTLCLDVDVVRSLVGGWRDDPSGASAVARRLALVMARTQLVEGADVVVPQLVARLEFVEGLAETADRAGVRFLEILLDVPRGVALERFSARSQSSADPLDRLAAEHLAGMSSTAPDPADPRVDAGSAMPAGRLRAVGSDGGMVAAEPDLVGSAAPSPSDRWGTGMATYAGRLADAVAARPGTVRIDASGPLDEVYSSFVDVLRAARLSR
ncbi:conserved hypothetical protein [Nostocoides japonicum T1-X7]|uniref:Uncharacterized protein n=2 Tax=Nostocoides japonicum TaxID=99481 RepID=A0A077M3K4_9MICO|nr:conserved hypothetical protein [Tetrasphaera japonica T1-X7]